MNSEDVCLEAVGEEYDNDMRTSIMRRLRCFRDSLYLELPERLE